MPLTTYLILSSAAAKLRRVSKDARRLAATEATVWEVVQIEPKLG